MSEDNSGETSFGGKELSYKDIVMRQLAKIITFSNVEFRGGYTTVNLSKDGSEKEVYVQDTRQVYGNAVFAFGLLLIPKFDKTMKDEFNDYQQKLKDLENAFMNKTKLKEEVVLGEGYYTEKEDKKEWHTLQIKKLKLHFNLFKSLNELLSRLNYFTFESFIEEDGDDGAIPEIKD